MARERDRGYWLSPPHLGPYISPRQALSIGIKRCGRCECWKRVDGSDFRGGFATAGQYPTGRKRIDAYCRQCRRAQGRASYYAHQEDRQRRSAESYRRRRANANTRRKMRRQERERQQRYRETSPEKEHARQKRYRDRVMADPVRAEAKRVKRNEWYANGGRDVIMASRARRRVRQRFARIILEALRIELARREEMARGGREEKREIRRAWIARRREAWESGEVGEIEPVWRGAGEDAELRRLPAAPLVAWMKRVGFSAEALAEQCGVNGRSMRRYTSGESLTIDIEVVDAIVTNTDALLFEIYDPGRFPAIYEVPEEPIVGKDSLPVAV